VTGAELTRRGVVLFDLDGTISDSERSILAAIRGAFAAHGIPALSPEQERTILGPPFYEVLPPFIGDVPVLAVIASYREIYVDGGGMFDTEVFAGVADLVVAVAEAGHRIALATSKPEKYAVQILQKLGLADCFETVGGDTVEGTRSAKAAVIEEVLGRLGAPDAGSVLMVGDRKHDILGAREHGIETVAVRWGYAPEGELEAAAPWGIAETPADVATLLGI
jgi:phosphoglycolate phosphatase